MLVVYTAVVLRAQTHLLRTTEGEEMPLEDEEMPLEEDVAMLSHAGAAELHSVLNTCQVDTLGEMPPEDLNQRTEFMRLVMGESTYFRFPCIPPSEIKTMTRVMKLMHFKAGVIIAHTNQRTTWMALVVRGQVTDT